MKTKKNILIFIGVIVVLLIILIAVWAIPTTVMENKNVDEKTESTSIANVEEKESTNEPTVNKSSESSNTVANTEMEKAISNFLNVWYTKKDRNEIEKLIGDNMTNRLKEKYFGTESIPTPANEGGDEVVEYRKSLDSLDVYVKQKDGEYAAMYEAETTITIGDNKSSSDILGKVKVINENGKWLVDNFEELDVEAK
ncbi:hypothetical protein [Priestia megaterium]|uniref:hypothetical protein n=1 Tax=Priestia megaterium TaxID=1404 RepID=UPI002FFF37AF